MQLPYGMKQPQSFGSHDDCHPLGLGLTHGGWLDVRGTVSIGEASSVSNGATASVPVNRLADHWKLLFHAHDSIANTGNATFVFGGERISSGEPTSELRVIVPLTNSA